MNPLGDPAKWPATLFDRWVILTQQEQIDDGAQKKAINKAVR